MQTPVFTSCRCHLAAVIAVVLVITANASHLHGESVDQTHAIEDVQLSDDVTLCESVSLHPVPDVTVGDRFWAISTRCLTSAACRVDLDQPRLSIYRVGCNGRATRASLDQYIETIGEGRRAVVYVHGNRMDSVQAIRRGLDVYRSTRRCARREPLDWVIWSWPSEKQGILVHDARRKFRRIDAQALYLSWILRKHVETDAPTTLVGYSFGGRVVTGALHALAGGKVGGRQLPGPPVDGAAFRCGLVAPAMDSQALSARGVHALATKNLDSLVLLYNRRDVVLKRFWLLQRVRGTMALGYSGPRSFAPRADGSKLPVRSRDCSTTVGRHHVELDYYDAPCNAGREMAALIDDFLSSTAD